MDDPPLSSNIAHTIFRDLRRQILGGQLKAGERLVGERELATKYGTNRNTLREAVRKLEQARLVTVRHGQGVTVADFRRTGTLELLSPFLETGPEAGEIATIIEDVLSPRGVLLEYATRLAIRRADKADIERLRDLTDLLITAFDKADAPVLARGFQRWLDALLDAAHSTAVRWIANPWLDVYRDILERFPTLWVLEPSFPAHLRGILRAFDARDEEEGVRVTREYYARVDAVLVGLLQAAAPVAPLGPLAAAAETSTSEPSSSEEHSVSEER